MASGGQPATAGREAKPSLVDIAEEALRGWLATGRHRPGERLPPEQELSAHLGISRGTLRTALQRLEDTTESQFLMRGLFMRIEKLNSVVMSVVNGSDTTRELAEMRRAVFGRINGGE